MLDSDIMYLLISNLLIVYNKQQVWTPCIKLRPFKLDTFHELDKQLKYVLPCSCYMQDKPLTCFLYVYHHSDAVTNTYFDPVFWYVQTNTSVLVV